MLKRKKLYRPGLIAEWKMDDGSGQTITDYSGKDNNLMSGNSIGEDDYDITWNSPSSLNFDGDNDYCSDYVLDSEQGTLQLASVANGAYITDDGQDFTNYIRSQGISEYIVVVKDSDGSIRWGYLGDMPGESLGSELITNGSFDSDTTGWSSGFDAALSSVAGGQSGNCLLVAGPDSNVLTDGNLENWDSSTDLTSWDENVAASSTVNQDENSYVGTYAARLDIDGSGSYVGIQQLFNYTDGAVYELIIVAKVDSAGSNKGFYPSTDASDSQGLTGSLGYDNNATECTDSYTEYSFIFVANSNDDIVAIYRHYPAATSYSLYIGQIKLRRVQSYYAGTSVSCDIGALYKTTAYIKKKEEATVRLWAAIDSGGSSPQIEEIESTESWVQYEYTWVAKVSTMYILLQVLTGNGTDGAYFDEVSVKRVESPSSSTGITIYSTKTGTTQSWSYGTTDFSDVGIDSYEIRTSGYQLNDSCTVGFIANTSDPVENNGLIDKTSYGLKFTDNEKAEFFGVEDNDGTSWSEVYDSDQDRITSLGVFNNSLYAGGEDKLFYSADGTNWSLAQTFTGSNFIYGIEPYDSTFFIGTSQTGAAKIYRSSNGTDWTEVYDTEQDTVWCIVSFDSDIYAGTGASGKLYKSENGTDWSEVYDCGDTVIRSLTVFNGYLYAGTGTTNGKIYRSSNGTDFSEVYDTEETQVFCFCVFENYLYAGTSGGKIFRSSNGTSWIEVFDSEQSYVLCIFTYEGYLYTGTGNNGKVYRSINGTDWDEVYDDTDSRIYSSSVFKGVMYIGTYDSGKIKRSGTGFGLLTSNDIDADTKYCLTGSYNGSVAKLYMNNTEEDSKSSSITLADNFNKLFVGQLHGSCKGGTSTYGEAHLKGNMYYGYMNKFGLSKAAIVRNNRVMKNNVRMRGVTF